MAKTVSKNKPVMLGEHQENMDSYPAKSPNPDAPVHVGKNRVNRRVVCTLRTPDDVLAEMGVIYRAMKGNTIDLAKGAKLVWTLGEIRKTQESAILHQRIALLEHQMAQGAPALPEHVDTPDEQAAEEEYLADLVVNEPDAAEPQLVGGSSTLD